MEPDLRAAEAADVPAIRTVLARAYAANPLLRWVFPPEDFPDDTARAEATSAWLGPSVERYLAHGVVHVALVRGAVVGVAAWRSPARSRRRPRPRTCSRSSSVPAGHPRWLARSPARRRRTPPPTT